jgi:hypothetical protein
MKGAQNAECRIVSFGTVSMAFAALLAFIFMLFLSGTNSDFQIWLFGIKRGLHHWYGVWPTLD